LKAEESWNATFRDHRGPSKDMVEKVAVKGHPGQLIEFLVGEGIKPSRTMVRQLVAQQGIRVNGQTVDDPAMELKIGDEINIGKTQFITITRA
jgi:tyrosyl-tRNA synthetase